MKYVGEIHSGVIRGIEIEDFDRTITCVDELQDETIEHVLDLRLDLVKHSPTGFCWGYHGSGPAQAALAILADYFRDDQKALYLYQTFKNEVIAKKPMDSDFVITDIEIETALAGHENFS